MFLQSYDVYNLCLVFVDDRVNEWWGMVCKVRSALGMLYLDVVGMVGGGYNAYLWGCDCDDGE